MGGAREERRGYCRDTAHQAADGGLPHRERQAQVRCNNPAAGDRPGPRLRHHLRLIGCYLRHWLEQKIRLHHSAISPAPRGTRALCETTAGLLARKIARIAWAI